MKLRRKIAVLVLAGLLCVVLAGCGGGGSDSSSSGSTAISGSAT